MPSPATCGEVHYVGTPDDYESVFCTKPADHLEDGDVRHYDALVGWEWEDHTVKVGRRIRSRHYR